MAQRGVESFPGCYDVLRLCVTLSRFYENNVISYCNCPQHGSTLHSPPAGVPAKHQPYVCFVRAQVGLAVWFPLHIEIPGQPCPPSGPAASSSLVVGRISIHLPPHPALSISSLDELSYTRPAFGNGTLVRPLDSSPRTPWPLRNTTRFLAHARPLHPPPLRSPPHSLFRPSVTSAKGDGQTSAEPIPPSLTIHPNGASHSRVHKRSSFHRD